MNPGRNEKGKLMKRVIIYFSGESKGKVFM